MADRGDRRRRAHRRRDRRPGSRLATRSLRGEFRSFDPSSVRVVLLDGGKQPLATFGDKLSERAAKELDTSASSCVWARAWSASTRAASTSPTPTATPAGSPRYTTVWAAGVEPRRSRKDLAKASGARARSRRPHRGSARPHAAGSSRGLRRRRHDGPRQAAGRRRGRDAGRRCTRPTRSRGDWRASRAPRSSTATSAARPRSGAFTRSWTSRGCASGASPGWVVWAFVHLTFLTVQQPPGHAS